MPTAVNLKAQRAIIGIKSDSQPTLSALSLSRLLKLLSSVRFGVLLLILLTCASIIGMLIVQQDVEGFDRYFTELSATQQLLFRSLGFFNIYHSWYFDLLILTLSLNIVLASIDRFPTAWSFISKPKLDAASAWLKAQPVNATLHLTEVNPPAVTENIAVACRSVGLKPVISKKGNRTYVFAQRNAWNRLGAYAVHVALLTIFTGGFLTAQFGRTGHMPLRPGMSATEMYETVFNLDQLSTASVALPFEITCTDIEQKLIKKNGPISADNTIDWLTRIKINDETGTHDALVHLNRPYDYRGYRIFQESFIKVGRARSITLRLFPQQSGQPIEVVVPRDGRTKLQDGTSIDFVNFLPDFKLAGREATTGSGEYDNPAAVLNVTPAGGTPQKAYAFLPAMAAGTPLARQPVAGYSYQLLDFEKVPDAHVLAIQKDPGSTIFYLGGALLVLALASVFFFSHQRVWAVIEERDTVNYEVVLGGNTNRNVVALEDRFKKLIANLTAESKEVKKS